MAMPKKSDVTKIKPTELTNAIANILDIWNDEVTDAVRYSIHDVSVDTVHKLRLSSPRRSGPGGGEYAKSWTLTHVIMDHNDMAFYTEVVHNKKHYRLTHLLEKEHALRNGGRSKAQPHIKPAEEWAKKELEKRVKEAIEDL